LVTADIPTGTRLRNTTAAANAQTGPACDSHLPLKPSPNAMIALVAGHKQTPRNQTTAERWPRTTAIVAYPGKRLGVIDAAGAIAPGAQPQISAPIPR